MVRAQAFGKCQDLIECKVVEEETVVGVVIGALFPCFPFQLEGERKGGGGVVGPGKWAIGVKMHASSDSRLGINSNQRPTMMAILPFSE